MSSAHFDVDIANEILDDFVRVANEAADAAGNVVRKFFRKRHLIQTINKYDEDGSIVEETTNVDQDAEDALASVILQNFSKNSNHSVFGEERGWRGDVNADYVWVLDPIDGTTSFKNGSHSFGTLIALLYKNKPILGIIDQPTMRDRWVGVQGRRTTMNDEDVRTRFCEHLSRATLYTSSPLHFSDKEREDFDCVAEKVTEPIYGAECSTYGLLAAGFVDVIIQSFLQPYDFLAFVPIIEGAGGIITDWAGQKLKWEAPPMSIGSYCRIIAAGDTRVHKDALEYLTST